MNKSILMFFGFVVIIMITHHFHRLPRPKANVVAPLKESFCTKRAAPQSFLETIIATSPIGLVHNTNYLKTSRNSNTIATLTLAIPNDPVVDDGKEIAEQDKFRLLRELREKAEKNPEVSLAGALRLPAGDERNQALSAVCFGLAQNDPADAVKLAQSLNLDNQPGAILENLIQQWSTADLPSALEWANDQPAGGQRDELMMRVAYIMSQSDPSDAAQLVINQIPLGPAQNEATMMVLNQWANQNLTAAANWAKGLPAGPLQDRAISELEGIQNRQQPLAHQ